MTTLMASHRMCALHEAIPPPRGVQKNSIYSSLLSILFYALGGVVTFSERTLDPSNF